jgi:hypothetical protein
MSLGALARHSDQLGRAMPNDLTRSAKANQSCEGSWTRRGHCSAAALKTARSETGAAELGKLRRLTGQRRAPKALLSWSLEVALAQSKHGATLYESLLTDPNEDAGLLTCARTEATSRDTSALDPRVLAPLRGSLHRAAPQRDLPFRV